MMKRLPSCIAPLATMLLLGVCAVGPHYAGASPPVPPGFAGSDPRAAEADLTAWWRTFGDAELDALVDRALAGDLDRQAARVSRADLFPQLSGNASASYTKISENAGLSSLTKLFAGGGGQGGRAAEGSSAGGPSAADAGVRISSGVGGDAGACAGRDGVAGRSHDGRWIGECLS